MNLRIGWENGFGEKLQGYSFSENEQTADTEKNYGVFGDSLIDEEKMYQKYLKDNEIDCGDVDDDEVRIDYDKKAILETRKSRFDDPFTQEEIDSLRTNRVM